MNQRALFGLGDDAGPASTPFNATTQASDSSTFELKLPSYLCSHESTPIALEDGKLKTSGVGAHPAPQHHRAKLHFLNLSHPELCQKCSCKGTCDCPTYTDLWERFLAEAGVAEAAKRDIIDQLDEWHSWALDPSELTAAQVKLCFGPVGHARAYDRAWIGDVCFTCTRLEESKIGKDSVVLLNHNGELCAGRVKAFLSHSAPGSASGQEHELNIAHVHWYAFVPDAIH